MRIDVKDGVVLQRLFPGDGDRVELSEGGQHEVEVSEVHARLDQVWRGGMTLLGHRNVLDDQILDIALAKDLLLLVDEVGDVDEKLGSLVMRVGEEGHEVRQEGLP